MSRLMFESNMGTCMCVLLIHAIPVVAMYSTQRFDQQTREIAIPPGMRNQRIVIRPQKPPKHFVLKRTDNRTEIYVRHRDRKVAHPTFNIIKIIDTEI
jgi:hypothetical protein